MRRERGVSSRHPMLAWQAAEPGAGAAGGEAVPRQRPCWAATCGWRSECRADKESWWVESRVTRVSLNEWYSPRDTYIL